MKEHGMWGGGSVVFKRKENGFLATKSAKQTLVMAEVTEVTSRLSSCWLLYHFWSANWAERAGRSQS